PHEFRTIRCRNGVGAKVRRPHLLSYPERRDTLQAGPDRLVPARPRDQALCRPAAWLAGDVDTRQRGIDPVLVESEKRVDLVDRTRWTRDQIVVEPDSNLLLAETPQVVADGLRVVAHSCVVPQMVPTRVAALLLQGDCVEEIVDRLEPSNPQVLVAGGNPGDPVP